VSDEKDKDKVSMAEAGISAVIDATDTIKPVEEGEVETLFEFPCQFPVKAMGPCCEEIEAAVLGIIRRHVKDLSEGAVTIKPSKKGNYTAITVMITAHSKKQLDAIYLDLTACEHVSIAL